MKLCALTITNFASIGEPGLTIPIDDIVVLIGPNNSGKSSVLSAYEAFASTGSSLPLRSFRDEDPNRTISISGVFSDLTDGDGKALGAKWEYDDPEFGKAVKAKWEWAAPDQKAQKFSWDNDDGKWVAGGMGGWDTLITSRIPVPLRVRPTDDPEETEKQIIQILTAAAKAALKKDSEKAGNVLRELQTLADEFAKDAQKELDDACARITTKLDDIFPGHKVSLQQSVGKIDPDKIIASGSHVRIEEPGKDAVPLSHQGAGMRRTFLWSALGTLAEMGRVKQGTKKIDAERQRMLLIEEPESFLHPPMIRSARDALYDLAVIAEWQVLTCTHSPIFIDVSKPHTTIMRVEKKTIGEPKVFSTENAEFSDDDRTQLRMIRSCHPTVSEFFFADHVFLVEGETEQAVLNHVLANAPASTGTWCHVVNCMGKANLPLFARILNHFGTPYTIIHDADAPMSQRSKGTWVKNGMWTINKRIADVISERKVDLPACGLVAHIPDFEGFYFGEELSADKPYHAITMLNSTEFKKSEKYTLLIGFADSVLKGKHPGCYTAYKGLTALFEAWRNDEKPSPTEAWEFEKHE
ncbi:MAG: AAA family ATPase [Deltaproteobacteria bacterium]|nr:AAA family ATPase [Deltaproteobacteria bacterium]